MTKKNSFISQADATALTNTPSEVSNRCTQISDSSLANTGMDITSAASFSTDPMLVKVIAGGFVAMFVLGGIGIYVGYKFGVDTRTRAENGLHSAFDKILEKMTQIKDEIVTKTEAFSTESRNLAYSKIDKTLDKIPDLNAGINYFKNMGHTYSETTKNLVKRLNVLKGRPQDGRGDPQPSSHPVLPLDDTNHPVNQALQHIKELREFQANAKKCSNDTTKYNAEERNIYLQTYIDVSEQLEQLGIAISPQSSDSGGVVSMCSALEPVFLSSTFIRVCFVFIFIFFKYLSLSGWLFIFKCRLKYSRR